MVTIAVGATDQSKTPTTQYLLVKGLPCNQDPYSRTSTSLQDPWFSLKLNQVSDNQVSAAVAGDVLMAIQPGIERRSMNSTVERRLPGRSRAEQTSNNRLLFCLLQPVTVYQVMAKLPAVRPLSADGSIATTGIMWKSPRTRDSCPTENLKEANILGTSLLARI